MMVMALTDGIYINVVHYHKHQYDIVLPSFKEKMTGNPLYFCTETNVDFILGKKYETVITKLLMDAHSMILCFPLCTAL